MQALWIGDWSETTVPHCFLHSWWRELHETSCSLLRDGIPIESTLHIDDRKHVDEKFLSPIYREPAIESREGDMVRSRPSRLHHQTIGTALIAGTGNE